MKHMIDVSEKYAVSDIFDSINMFNKLENELEPPLEKDDAIEDYYSIDRRPGRKISRQSKSLFSLHSPTEKEIAELSHPSPRTKRLQSMGGAVILSSSQQAQEQDSTNQDSTDTSIEVS